MKRKWTNKTLTAYCRFVLRDYKELLPRIKAVYVPRRKLKHDATTDNKSPTVFYSDRNLDESTVWHECGHLIEHSNYSFRPMYVASSIGKRNIEEKETEIDRKWIKKEIAFEERVECERFAHCWAIKEAKKRGYKNILKKLLLSLDFWDSDEIYAEAKSRILKRIGQVLI